MKFKLLSAFGLAVLSTSLIAAETLRSTPAIDVFSVTPLPGIGLTLDKIPSNIQTVKDKDLKKQQSLSIADYMNDNLQGVSVNDTQNNPYQPDITFRGYSVSPILGGQTGMSVYVDGLRVNEPFGDGVNWDLIPVNAISGITLTPGSNPLFGLNTLGGALSVQTKSGRTHQGIGAEVSLGSWGRKTTSAEFGGVSEDGSKDFFISANSFREDGWRNYSPSDVRQLFIKTGWQNEKTKVDLSFTGANNDMVGNGLIQKNLMSAFGRNVIHTRPDQTQNQLASFNLSASHWINKDLMFSANTYHRHSKRLTLNGDINDDLVAADFSDADCRASHADSDEMCSGAVNRSRTKQRSTGINAQLEFNQDFLGKKNQFIAGTFYDVSNIKYDASTVFGVVNATRGIDTFGVVDGDAAVDLNGKTKTLSFFGTDTFSINDQWHLTMSGRFNRINVVNKDTLVPNPSDIASLSGDHTFRRLNPALGLNYAPTKSLTLYGSYNEGNRAPTSMELGCANPARPCKLPNAMAGDPPLKQVVAKTYELGLRGDILQNTKWSVAAYRSENHDDIQFLSSSAVTNLGYFDNVGKTRRVGLDLALSGDADKLTWSLGYSYVKATYQSELELLNEVNSSSYETPAGADVIKVSKGNRLANIPDHQFKARLQYALNQDWYIGTNITAFSDRFMRGNENNKHVSTGDSMGNGKIGGYTIVNLDTRYNVGKGLSVFAKAINIFDREYNSGGMMGESHFGNNGVFTADQTNTGFVSPGAPRAGWIGLRYEFGGAPEAK